MRSRTVQRSTQASPIAVAVPEVDGGGLLAVLPARVVRVDEVISRTGLSRTTLWRLERRGAFPARRQLSPGTVGWIEAEVEAWILGRVTRAAGWNDRTQTSAGDKA